MRELLDIRALRLVAMAAEATDLGRRLSALAGADRSPLSGAGIYAARRRRDAMFPAGLFADPAWDMLLDLLVAAEAGQRLSTSAVAIGSCVPATTALRWISRLKQAGLVVATADPADRRRAFITLSAEGHKRMANCLDQPAI